MMGGDGCFHKHRGTVSFSSSVWCAGAAVSVELGFGVTGWGGIPHSAGGAGAGNGVGVKGGNEHHSYLFPETLKLRWQRPLS